MGDLSAERMPSVELLATAETMSRATGIVLDPPEQEAHDRDLAVARDRLGQSVFDAAFARGERLTPEEAIDLALNSSDERLGRC
jgi:hypothetical protein